jgi:hypothetical protein
MVVSIQSGWTTRSGLVNTTNGIAQMDTSVVRGVPGGAAQRG